MNARQYINTHFVERNTATFSEFFCLLPDQLQSKGFPSFDANFLKSPSSGNSETVWQLNFSVRCSTEDQSGEHFNTQFVDELAQLFLDKVTQAVKKRGPKFIVIPTNSFGATSGFGGIYFPLYGGGREKARKIIKELGLAIQGALPKPYEAWSYGFDPKRVDKAKKDAKKGTFVIPNCLHEYHGDGAIAEGIKGVDRLMLLKNPLTGRISKEAEALSKGGYGDDMAFASDNYERLGSTPEERHVLSAYKAIQDCPDDDFPAFSFAIRNALIEIEMEEEDNEEELENEDAELTGARAAKMEQIQQHKHRMKEGRVTLLGSLMQTNDKDLFALVNACMNMERPRTKQAKRQFQAQFGETLARITGHRNPVDARIYFQETLAPKMHKALMDNLLNSSPITDKQADELASRVRISIDPQVYRGLNERGKADFRSQENMLINKYHREIKKLIRVTGGYGEVRTIAGGDDRAHADPRSKSIKLSVRDDLMQGGKSDNTTRALWHEWGHHVEYSSDKIFQASELFKLEKSYSFKPKWLGEPYDRNEVAIEGDFSDLYVGKVYGDYATEVVSMTLEKLASPSMMVDLLATPDELIFAIGLMKQLQRKEFTTRPITPEIIRGQSKSSTEEGSDE